MALLALVHPREQAHVSVVPLVAKCTLFQAMRQLLTERRDRGSRMSRTGCLCGTAKLRLAHSEANLARLSSAGESLRAALETAESRTSAKAAELKLGHSRLQSAPPSSSVLSTLLSLRETFL
jgi:hypothetical protein